jgi:hypothetical protein
MMDTASTLGLKGRELDMAERRMNELRDQQMFDRRQSEQKALGQFAGQFGPGLLNELQRVRDRNNPYLGTTKATTDQIVADFAKADRMAGVQPMTDNLGLPTEPTPSFDNLGFQQLTGRQGVTYQPLDTFRPYLEGPQTSYGFESMPTRSGFRPESTTIGDLESLMNIGDFTGGRNSNFDTSGSMGMSQGNPLSQENAAARNDVFNMQNPYALDGQIIEFQGQFFRKTPTGWEQLG